MPLAFAMPATVGVGVPAPETREPDGELERRVQRLIEQLGDEDYFVRRRAQEELGKFSFEAFDALVAATTHEDLEIAARAKYLLRSMQVEWTTKEDPPEVKALLKNYHGQDNAVKLVRIRSLAALPDHKGVPALCRLVRFECSPVLSKYAAIALFELRPGRLAPLGREGQATDGQATRRPPPKELAELLRKHLDGSRRTAARWLLTWFRLAEDPAAFVADWTKLVEAERSRLARSPEKTSPDIVARLIRLQIRALKRLGRNEQVVAAMDRLIDLERGNPETLAELLDWLVEEKAWSVVKKLTDRFAFQLAGNPLLLYKVARAQAEQGRQQLAEETARRALKLNPGKDSTSLRKHFYTALQLQDRGQFPWAQQEFRHVIETGSSGSLEVVFAQSSLGEMLHDLGRQREAAEVLEPMAEALKQHPHPETSARIKLPNVLARMNFFHACYWKNEQNTAKQREYLDKALEASPADPDVLIACYRLPDQPPEYRQKILRLIQKSAAEIRRQIAAQPTLPTPYNQFAWLVGNTEGDLKEALKYSKKSIQLNPSAGGYYDTLAHVYFAQGDYENAVKTQTKAAELEPHSGAIARALEVFRRKWEEEKKKPEEKRAEPT